MTFQVGDLVRVRSARNIVTDRRWGNALPEAFVSQMVRELQGKTMVVTKVHSGMVFCVFEGGAWAAPFYWLEPAPKGGGQGVPVSVGWDLSRDLSITQGQYRRICGLAQRAGRTTTEVLRMLVAAGLELLGEEKP